jgi:hypothetical protein
MIIKVTPKFTAPKGLFVTHQYGNSQYPLNIYNYPDSGSAGLLIYVKVATTGGQPVTGYTLEASALGIPTINRDITWITPEEAEQSSIGEYLLKITNLTPEKQYTLKIALKNSVGASEIVTIPGSSLTIPKVRPTIPSAEFYNYQPTDARVQLKVTISPQESFENLIVFGYLRYDGEPPSDETLLNDLRNTRTDMAGAGEIYTRFPLESVQSYSYNQISGICDQNFGSPYDLYNLCMRCLWGAPYNFSGFVRRTVPLYPLITTPGDKYFWIPSGENTYEGGITKNTTTIVYPLLLRSEGAYYYGENLTSTPQAYAESAGLSNVFNIFSYFTGIPDRIDSVLEHGWEYTSNGWRYVLSFYPPADGGLSITEYGYYFDRTAYDNNAYAPPYIPNIDSDDLTYVNTFEQRYDSDWMSYIALIIDPPRFYPSGSQDLISYRIRVTIAAKNANGAAPVAPATEIVRNTGGYFYNYYLGNFNILAIGIVDHSVTLETIGGQQYQNIQILEYPYLKVYYEIDRNNPDYVARMNHILADPNYGGLFSPRYKTSAFNGWLMFDSVDEDSFGFFATSNFLYELAPQTTYDYTMKLDTQDYVYSPETNFTFTTGAIVQVVSLVAKSHYSGNVVLAYTGETYALLSRQINWYYKEFGSEIINIGGAIYKTFDKVFMVNSPALIAGKSYYFYIKVTNIFGQSEYSPASNLVSITLLTTPALAPRVTVIPSDSMITVYVDKLSNALAGGLPVTNYQMMFSPTDDPDYQFTSFNPPRSQSSLYPAFYYPPGSFGNPLAVIDGLANGREYMISVSAINDKGVGQQSPIVKATPLGVPNFPRVLATVGDRSVTVAFIPPLDTGGSPILKYQYSTDAGQTWLDAFVAGTTNYDLTSPIVITKHSVNNQSLNNGQLYQVRLRAVNAQGPGDASITIQATPVGPPSPPVIDEIVSSDKQLVVKFTPPIAQNADTPVLGYKYSLDDDYENFNKDTYITVVPTNNQFTISGATIPVGLAPNINLRNNSTYTIRLKAYNVLGDGEPYVATGTPMPLPPALEITRIVPRSKKLDVYFVRNYVIGGPEVGNIDRIWYTLNGGEKLTETTLDLVSPLTITGGDPSSTGLLTNNVPYTIRLYGKNTAGFGAAYNAVTGIPTATLPTAPTITSLVSNNQSGQLVVSFNPPTDIGGTSIIDYEYIAYTSGQETSAIAVSSNKTSSPIVINKLTNGEVYFVKVRAVNAVGAGPFSNYLYRRPLTSPLFEITRIDPVATDLVSPQLQVTYDVLEDGGYGLYSNPEGPFTIQYKVSKFANFSGAAWQSYRTTGNLFKYVTNPFYIDVPLEYDTEYYVKIKADLDVNQTENAGNFIESEPFAVTPQKTIPPSAPIITQMLAPERGTVHIYFTPGPANGTTGTLIGYKWVDMKAGGTTHLFSTASTSPLVISGLADAYYVNLKLVAYNEYGDSAPSNEGAVVTPGLPFAPTILNSKFTQETGVLLVNFIPPYYVIPENHRPVINYAYTVTQEGLPYPNATVLATPTTTSPLSISVSGIVGDGSRYLVRLAAINEIGVGAFSAVNIFTPPLGPEPPEILGFVPGLNSITVNYKAPEKSGSGNLIGYTCKYSNNAEPFTFSSTGEATGSFTIPNLTVNTYYVLILRAVNALNVAGLPSKAATAHTAIAPSIQQVGYDTQTSDIFLIPTGSTGATGASTPVDGSFLFISSRLYRYGSYAYSDQLKYVNGKAYRPYTGWYDTTSDQIIQGAPGKYYTDGVADTNSQDLLNAKPLTGAGWVDSSTLVIGATGG